MGEPLRKEPGLEHRPTSPEFKIYHGSSERGRHWVWLLIIAVAAGLAIWALSRSGHRAPARSTAVPTAANAPASDRFVEVSTVLSNKNDYIGKSVRLRDVTIQSVNDNSIFVGSPDAQQILVILKPGAVPDTLQGKSRTLSKGAIVTITGTAQKPGSVKELQHSANISPKEAEKVVNSGVLIEADRAQPQIM